MGRLADEDFLRLRRLLEPCGGVDRIADNEALPPARVASDHLAGIDACTVRDRHAPGTLERLVQPRELRVHLDGGPNRAQRILLVQERDAEHRHDRIADELLDGAAVPFHDGPDDIEIPEAGYTFGTLKNAQATGDLQTLRSHGLPAERIRLEGDPAEAVVALTEKIKEML